VNAYLRRTLIRLLVFRNPHLCSALLRTNETTILHKFSYPKAKGSVIRSSHIFASSPWKLSTVASLIPSISRPFRTSCFCSGFLTGS
jgi:hypothetical protein